MFLPVIIKQVTSVRAWSFPVAFLITSQVALALLLEATMILFKYNTFAVEMTLLNILQYFLYSSFNLGSLLFQVFM
jgi:hypothetical protein